MSQNAFLQSVKRSHRKWRREPAFLPPYPFNERKLSPPIRQCFKGTFLALCHKACFQTYTSGVGWGVRFFSFVAGTHPLWLKFWQPIRTVPKIGVTTMKTSAMVLMLCSEGAFGCLVRRLVYLLVLFFPLQCEVTKSRSSGKGGRQDCQSTGFNKSTHLKVPGLDLHAKFHVKGSLSHYQTCWHILHTHQVWSCECLEWSICRKLGWDGPPWVTSNSAQWRERKWVAESQGPSVCASGPVAFESWVFVVVVRLIPRISDKWLQGPLDGECPVFMKERQLGLPSLVNRKCHLNPTIWAFNILIQSFQRLDGCLCS